MTKEKTKEKKVPEIHIGDKVLFFTRLSDITRLPDWFKEDEDKDPKRFQEKWDFFLGALQRHGIPIHHSQWYKFVFSTDDKTRLYLEDCMTIILSFLTQGVGKLAIVDGYSPNALLGYGHNIGLALQIKRINSTLPPTDELYIPATGLSENFVQFNNRLIYVNSVENHQDIDNRKKDFADLAEKYKYHFVDLSEGDWLKDRFPSLNSYFEAKKKWIEMYSGGHRIPTTEDPPIPVGSGGGGVVLN